MSWRKLHEAGKLKLARYNDAAKCVSATQENLLKSILQANKSTKFGEQFGFSKIVSYRDFSERIPITTYDEYTDWIELIKAGQLNVLTSDPPFAFEETGGSSGGRKLIPYNAKLIQSFQNSILAWLAGLQNFYPAICDGPAYFAISPTTRNFQKSAGCLPIGLQSDALYFGEEHEADAANIMLGAAELSGIRDFNTWQNVTLSWLLATESLSFISIWSPTFLTTLLDSICGKEDDLIKAICNGEFGLNADKQRARFVSKLLKQNHLNTVDLWPQLKVVSSWADAGSARYYQSLKALFPGVVFQPKGLLSTESIVAIPLSGAEFPLPALTSTFLEFETPDGQIRLLHELEESCIYKVMVTTPGGLYRYMNEDQVRCMGYYNGFDEPLPMLSFYGRGDYTLDLVGEKLEEGFIAHCLRETKTFAALYPVDSPQPHYALLLDKTQSNPNELALGIEENLLSNPLYADARKNGQLGELTITKVKDAEACYFDWRLKQGHRLSDIKLPILINSEKLANEIWPEFS